MIILLAVAIFVYFVIVKGGEERADSTRNHNSTTVKTPIQTPPVAKGNTLQYFTNTPSEQQFSFAKIRNNTVYCCMPSGREFKIGSYERNHEGDYDVWDEDHVCRIGKIMGNSVFFTLLDSYEYFKKMNPYTKYPPSFIPLVATWNGYQIIDYDTKAPIATYEGNSVAASAAFVCLTNDLLSNNKYYHIHHFWK